MAEVILTDQQKKEEFNGRVKSFQVDLKNLMDNYKVELMPIINFSPMGIFPQLTINDKKYETLGNNNASGIIQPEQFTKDEPRLAANKEIVERATKTPKKGLL